MPSPSYKGLGESGAFGRNPGCLSPTLGYFTQLYGPQTTSIVEDFLKKDQFQPIRPFGPLRAKPLCTHFAQGGGRVQDLTGVGKSDTAGYRAAGRPGSLSGDSRRRGPQGVWPV